MKTLWTSLLLFLMAATTIHPEIDRELRNTFQSVRDSYASRIENDKRQRRRNISPAELQQAVHELLSEFSTTNDDETVSHLCDRVILEAALLKHYRGK